jgi:hypothetical protein
LFPEIQIMFRPFAMTLPLFLLGTVLLMAQGTGGDRAGPKEGEFLPKPFGCYTFNGLHKGKIHSMVVDYGLNPSVLVFARESEDGKDGPALSALLKRLEQATVDYKSKQLHAAVIYLSPDAQSSATNSAEKDPAKLVEEAKKRDELYARVAKRAEDFKTVDVGVFGIDGPTIDKDYKLRRNTEVCVVVYAKLRVIMSRAYDEANNLTEAEVEKIMATVKDTVEPPKKK